MITGRDFIFTGLQPWDISIGSNAKDIALEISKNNRVLYVNTPLDFKTFFYKDKIQENEHRRKVVKGQEPILRQLSSSFWVLDLPFTIFPINKLPDGICFDFFNYWNNNKIFSFVKKELSKLNFNNCILFIDNDVYRSFYANELLKPAFAIYYRRDNLFVPYWMKHIGRLEPKICKKCNVVLANSIHLAEMVSNANPNSFDVGQGIDLLDYDININYSVPKDIKDITPPIVGYAGLITSLRLDADLLFEVASKLHNLSFVLVGDEDEHFKSHKLHTLSNIYFLGGKKSHEIPSYIYQFNVCINPQLINEVTIGNYPRKIDEYLALGKPVIATKTKAMEMFDSVVWNCIGAEEYINAIKIAINKNSNEDRKRRIDFAKSHSWANSVESIYSYIK